MLGKILKTLLGLGSASAAAAGGLYLNNKLKETKENSLEPGGVNGTKSEEVISAERLAFIKLADDNTTKIEEAMKSEDATNSYYLPRSTDSDEYWEWLWLDELNGIIGNKPSRTYTEEELRKKEEEIWGHIKNDTYMGAVPKDKKEKIDNENSEYWRKYKETCLTWSSIDTSKRSSDYYFQCLSSSEAEYFANETHYRKYKELKASKPDLTLGKFLWTMWFKFLKEGKKESTNWGKQFDDWKSKNSSLFD